mgnify:FL=1
MTVDRYGNDPNTIPIEDDSMNSTLYKKEMEEYLKNGGTVKCEYGEVFLSRRFRTVEERVVMDREDMAKRAVK